jgi:hypothetical protein
MRTLLLLALLSLGVAACDTPTKPSRVELPPPPPPQPPYDPNEVIIKTPPPQ